MTVVWGTEGQAVGRTKLLLSAGCGCGRGLDRNRFLAVALLLSGLANVDATLEEGAIFNADALRDDVACKRAFVADVYAVAGVQVAADFAEHNHFASVDVGSYLSIAADGYAIAGQVDGTFHLAVDVQRFGTGDFTFNYQALANGRLLLGIQDGVAVGGGGGWFGGCGRTRSLHG